jgi:TetR/AcrR family transcriptional regulator, mexJK operon transcriptional repressor
MSLTDTGTRAATRRGGRPTEQQAAELGERILAVATRLFLRDGFGATSIEAIAVAAGVSKRTFYHRFRDKPDLFRAVVHALIARWLPPFEAQFRETVSLETMLQRTAKQVLAAALSPEALSLHRLLMAEAQRFPELAAITTGEGARRGIERIAQLIELEAQAGRIAPIDATFAAEQFFTMVLAVPQRRALGFGERMNAAALEEWTQRTVALFLKGCRGAP